jgi:hypothetical protein
MGPALKREARGAAGGSLAAAALADDSEALADDSVVLAGDSWALVWVYRMS